MDKDSFEKKVDNLVILATQSDTKLTILVDSFSKHLEDDKLRFQEHGQQIKGIDRKIIYGSGFISAVVLFINWIFKK